MEPILGQILMFAGGYTPKGWAICNGQTLPISQYQALFSILGVTYGGDGRTTFGLPDFRGRLPVHAGAGINFGERGGEAANTLTVAQLPVHTHPVTATTMACSSLGGSANVAGQYSGLAPGSFKPYAAANAGAAVYAGEFARKRK